MSANLNYRFRDLLALEPLTADEITFILDQAKPFQQIQRNPLKKLATLRGKTVALAFFENSTRTRLSFATAASRLGADTMNLQAEASSLKKGETLLDTANNLNAMKPDCFVMRHSSSGAADFVARGDDPRSQGHAQQLERYDSWRYFALSCCAFEHSPPGEIRLPLHTLWS